MEKSFSTLAEMAAYYQSELRSPLDREFALCRAVVASSALTDAEKAEALLMGGHQRRLRSYPAARDRAVGTLTKAALWKRTYADFEQLYAAVSEAIADVPHVGPLALYDTAKRIGHCCGCEPKRLVYLAADGHKGAKRLLGLPRMGRIVEAETFGRYFPGLSAIDLENVLCIMNLLFVPGGVDPKATEDFGDIYYRNAFSKGLTARLKELQIL